MSTATCLAAMSIAWFWFGFSFGNIYGSCRVRRRYREIAHEECEKIRDQWEAAKGRGQ